MYAHLALHVRTFITTAFFKVCNTSVYTNHEQEHQEICVAADIASQDDSTVLAGEQSARLPRFFQLVDTRRCACSFRDRPKAPFSPSLPV